MLSRDLDLSYIFFLWWTLMFFLDKSTAMFFTHRPYGNIALSWASSLCHCLGYLWSLPPTAFTICKPLHQLYVCLPGGVDKVAEKVRRVSLEAGASTMFRGVSLQFWCNFYQLFQREREFNELECFCELKKMPSLWTGNFSSEENFQKTAENQHLFQRPSKASHKLTVRDQLK